MGLDFFTQTCSQLLLFFNYKVNKAIYQQHSARIF